MKIGFFDSGVGGLTVLREFLNTLETEKLKNTLDVDILEIYYLADLINAPYGPKTSDKLLDIIHNNINYLENNLSCEYIISACNSASAIYSKNKNYTEMIKPTANFCKLKKYKRNLLLATAATINSGIYKKEFKALSINLDSLSLPMLANMIEEGISEDVIGKYIDIELENYKLEKQKIDKCFDYINYDNIILGCTHYPLVQHLFEKFLKQNILDPGIPVAKEIFDNLNILSLKSLRLEKTNTKTLKIKLNFILTKESKVFKNKVQKMFLEYGYSFST